VSAPVRSRGPRCGGRRLIACSRAGVPLLRRSRNSRRHGRPGAGADRTSTETIKDATTSVASIGRCCDSAATTGDSTPPRFSGALVGGHRKVADRQRDAHEVNEISHLVAALREYFPARDFQVLNAERSSQATPPALASTANTSTDGYWDYSRAAGPA